MIGSGGEAPVTKVSMSRLTTGYEVSREEERKKHHLFSHVKLIFWFSKRKRFFDGFRLDSCLTIKRICTTTPTLAVCRKLRHFPKPKNSCSVGSV